MGSEGTRHPFICDPARPPFVADLHYQRQDHIYCACHREWACDAVQYIVVKMGSFVQYMSVDVSCKVSRAP
jgi:hypothetical protein